MSAARDLKHTFFATAALTKTEAHTRRAKALTPTPSTRPNHFGNPLFANPVADDNKMYGIWIVIDVRCSTFTIHTVLKLLEGDTSFLNLAYPSDASNHP